MALSRPAHQPVTQAVSPLKEKGMELVGEIETFEDSYKLCYVRGPEGIILELAEQLEK